MAARNRFYSLNKEIIKSALLSEKRELSFSFMRTFKEKNDGIVFKEKSSN